MIDFSSLCRFVSSPTGSGRCRRCANSSGWTGSPGPPCATSSPTPWWAWPSRWSRTATYTAPSSRPGSPGGSTATCFTRDIADIVSKTWLSDAWDFWCKKRRRPMTSLLGPDSLSYKRYRGYIFKDLTFWCLIFLVEKQRRSMTSLLEPDSVFCKRYRGYIFKYFTFWRLRRLAAEATTTIDKSAGPG